MSDVANRLRELPRVDAVLEHSKMVSASADLPHVIARQAAREAVEETRARIMAEEDMDVGLEAVVARACEMLHQKSLGSLRRAVNATGIVLHTGLGRAPMSEPVIKALVEVASGFSNVQVDLETGKRIQRETHVDWLLKEITGAEGTVVVNNNAAATMLVLNTMASGGEVIVSRGEMVEIGGSFRIPDIMRTAGCRLVEIGCTNRTHLRDYANAITPETALLMTVHQSNYTIEGFSSMPDIKELAELAHSKRIPFVHDLGSGALVDLAQFALPHEPSVPESLAADADVVLFSGDKLIGGPQCGIITGKAKYLEAMRKNPLYRTFRVGKLTLAALEATLRLFLSPGELPRTNRTISLLTTPLADIQKRAYELADRIIQAHSEWLSAETQRDESGIGGGSLAGKFLPTVAVSLWSESLKPDELASRLRKAEPPVFTRVSDNSVLLDPRTIIPGEEDMILSALEQVGQSLK